MTIFASIGKNRGLKIAFKGVLFLLLILGSGSHARAADDYTYSQTVTSSTHTVTGDNGTFAALPAYGYNGSFSASSTITMTVRLQRSVSTFDSSTMNNHGNLGPSIAWLSQAGNSTCQFRHFFTQADIDAMKAAYDASTYAELTWVVPMYSYNATTCTFTSANTPRIGIVGLNQTSNSGGVGTFSSTYASPGNGTAVNNIYLLINTTSPADSTATRIVSFSPTDGATVTGPSVPITEHIYINPDDLTGQLGIRLTLHNIDQNVLLLGFLSPGDITIFDGEATTSGDVYLGGTYPLADGNYRLNATLTRSYLYGWVINPFSSIDQDQSHQFVVGTATFIGTLTQNGYSEFNGILASTTATSTVNLAKNCNPLSFDIVYCLSFLFVPGGPQLQNTFVTFRDDVLQRVPWGYFIRAYSIMSASTTAALPSYTVSFQIGPPDNLATTSLSFDPGDMLAGAATLLTNTRDPQQGKNMRDVFEPFVQLTIALAVIFTIFADLTGSHKHHQDSITHR